MLGFDIAFALAIALAFGLCGLPLSFWLMRKEAGIGLLDRVGLGYALGWIGVPALLFAEGLAGLKFSAPLVPLNWLVFLLAGVALWVREWTLTPPSGRSPLSFLGLSAVFPPTPPAAVQAALLASLLALTAFVLLLPAGGLLYELDPYFYLDGVRQVALEGRNFNNDMTAWYPVAVSSHIGQPLFKYLVASWYSLYNGAAAYSPFTLVNVGSIYPPLAAALAAFFLYWLLRELYDERIGLLAAGLLFAVPTFVIELQAGKTQIVPYSFFALFFFLAMWVSALKRRTPHMWALVGVASLAIICGSNLGGLMTFFFSACVFSLGFYRILQPNPENDHYFKPMLALLGAQFAINAFQVLSIGLPLGADLVQAILSPSLLLPILAFLGPYAFGLALDRLKMPFSPLERAGVLAAVVVVGVLMAPHLPFGKSVVSNIVEIGAYSNALSRTIAEQQAGGAVHEGQFGFIAKVLDPSAASTSDALSNAVVAPLSWLNALPTLLLNLVFNTITDGLNFYLSLAGVQGNLAHINPLNSLFTFFLFASLSLLSIRLAFAYARREPWPLGSLILLIFIGLVSFIASAKQHLAPYLGIALLFAVAATVGEAVYLINHLSALLAPPAKKGHGAAHAPASGASHSSASSAHAKSAPGAAHSGHPAPAPGAPAAPPAGFQVPSWAVWAVVGMLILLQFGWPIALSPPWASSLLSTAALPSFQQNPDRVLLSFQAYCQSTGDPLICGVVNDPAGVRADPARFYDPYLCQRSLWLNASNPPDAVVMSIQYRCAYLSNYWVSSMDWISKNVPRDARVISWWDYGHWINFFGQTNTVLRNEHISTEMIGRTAHAYLMGDEAELRQTMRDYGSRYALMDIEILGSGSDKDHMAFGGKYSALNYLGCAWANLTDVGRQPGTSKCEQSHLWETIVAPIQPTADNGCAISQGVQGTVAYRLDTVTTAQGLQQTASPAYCLINGRLADGSQAVVSYSLSDKQPNGDLKIHPAKWVTVGNDGQLAQLVAVYDDQPLWRDASGQTVSSYPSRVGAFYNSTLYRGFMLNKLEGFDLVYSSPQIRIYKMQDAYYESAQK